MSRYLKLVALSMVAVTVIAIGVVWFDPLHSMAAKHDITVATEAPSVAVHDAFTATQRFRVTGRITQSHNTDALHDSARAAGNVPPPAIHPPSVTVTTIATKTSSTPVTTTQPSLSRNAQALGPYTVSGNVILAADGKPYLFHGVGRDSLEYTCWGDGHFDAQELSYMGSGTNTHSITYWGANTVRLPLSEGIWLNGESSQGCSAQQYQVLIKQTVDALTAMKLNVILDLQWSDAGGQSLQAGGPWAMPDADSVTFWQQMAGIYGSYSNVLFELFNEPHPQQWSCWAAACTITDTSYSDDCHCTKTFTFNSVGMQALVNAVRGTGANNLVLVAGMVWGYDLSQITKYPITGSNVVYDTHPYPYGGKEPSTWDAAFGTVSTHYPVISAESGEYDCGTSYMSQLLAYFDAHQIGWIGWAWVVQGDPCGYPQLIQNYQGLPTAGMGQLIYQRLRSYI
jgi:endoglucanase